VVTAGQPADATSDDIVVQRNGEPVARLRHDRAVVDRALATELLTESLSELDNIRLRAAVALQLEEVRDSRARIVSAQSDERRRIERNLHDGAQQRLLALAMQLRAAQLRHPSPLPTDSPADVEVLDHTISELATAVRELRDLANGLRPAVLADAGLVAALDDLAGRVPMHVELDVDPVEIGESTEDTLWFIACEAVANAVKHADATSLRITLSTDGNTVTLACHDNGTGLARSDGAGLRGIADRAETAGGDISVHSVPGTGTTIEAVLPCAS
jgi:signal transduction histidine kinase